MSTISNASMGLRSKHTDLRHRLHLLVDRVRRDTDDTPEELEILGDGRQEKSYMHVAECVDTICHVVDYADQDLNTYNLGTRTTTSVTAIADISSEKIELDPEYSYTGVDRGWTGDVPKMRLSIETLARLDWEPTQSSHEALGRRARELITELALKQTISDPQSKSTH